ncbi:DNA-binding transcriptional LysR family regulator [Palleronia aestuarii]|uniref:DNA-binding transcriptional LysR family regulator n=1 Tax=Palleronia aestuarii TaxID=568105 RepID=A0A2W7NEG0_9RHOB|nr:LysR family transcriptional regulator [Palleronia aestuarii]PZX18821.1 DNA-binding transcriptional LysR family regulator [Palleronia aestuarii]
MSDDRNLSRGGGDALVRRGLKFSQLRLMAALLETGRIGAAAAQSGMTQPAASRLLSQLENLLGTRLYARHPRGIVLTEAGRILAEQAVATLAGLDQSHDRIIQTVQGERGLVRLGSVTGPSLELVLPVIQRLRTTHPEIELSVQVETSDKLADALLAEDIDFYVGRIPQSTDARHFRFDPIGSEPLTIVARKDHPLAAEPEPTLRDCLAFEWVLQPPGGLMRRTVETYLLARKLPLPGKITATTSMLFTLALVDRTDAVAPMAVAVADFLAGRVAMDGRLIRLPVAGDLDVETYGIVRGAKTAAAPTVDRVIRGLTRQGRDLGR